LRDSTYLLRYEALEELMVGRLTLLLTLLTHAHCQQYRLSVAAGGTLPS
jgi:hypothetical protein